MFNKVIANADVKSFGFTLKASSGTGIIDCESEKPCGLRDGRGEWT